MALVAYRVVFSTLLFQYFVDAGIYLQSPRGSNNRINEPTADRRNDRRLFDSQNLKRGGYNIGDKGKDAADDMDGQFLMEYFMSDKDFKTSGGKTSLMLEWTNDLGCGTNVNDDNEQDNVNCNVVIQFNCRPPIDDLDNMRDGFSASTQDYDSPSDGESLADYNKRKEDEVRSNRGVHETMWEYDRCRRRPRNQGLYTGDVNVYRLNAIGTRQNPEGRRHGYECPEERDYYPYWHPSTWRDVAVMSENKTFCEEYYQKESYNVKTKWECLDKYPDEDDGYRHWSHHNTKADCESHGGAWLEFTNYLELAPQFDTKDTCEAASDNDVTYKWARPIGHFDEQCLVLLGAPECLDAPWTRPNHLGNGYGGEPVSYEWKIPFFPSAHQQRCVLRVRSNVTSSDYDAHYTDHTSNNKDVRSYDGTHCPVYYGACKSVNGDRRTDGVTKINDIDGNSEVAQAVCFEACMQTDGATGCEVRWNGNERGCYVHTKEVDGDGDGSAHHMCWSFSECWGKSRTQVKDGECESKGSKNCVFPFTYEGVVYNECSLAKASHWWCSTENNDDGTYKSWDYCVFPCGTAVNYDQVEQGKECSGSEKYQGLQPTLYDCYKECLGYSSLFVYGTNKHGEVRCWDGKCRCYCETEASKSLDGTCKHISHHGYDAYRIEGPPTFELVAEKTECSGKEYSRGYMANAEQCAVACKGWSTLFVFGTNDFGTNRCNDEGHCRCYCETQALKDGTCSQIDHAGYRLYKFTDSSNTVKDAPSDQDAFEVRTHLQIDTGIKGLRLQIAMRTQDIGKTSQDRTHVFLLNHREPNMQGKVIHNLNVRGKRGNIVQTFPATEYDFYPTDLKMATEDLVHIQWTGSNSHNNRRDGDAGEGTHGTDRSNICEMKDRSVNYPLPLPETTMWKNASVIWAADLSSKGFLDSLDVGVQMATAGFISCASECDNSVNDRKMQDRLNNAPASFLGMVLKFTPGHYHFLCSRNNNFSNRSQKGTLIVE